jgi:hypothetical protein
MPSPPVPPTTNGTIKEELTPSTHNIESTPKSEPLLPTLLPPTTNQQAGLCLNSFEIKIFFLFFLDIPPESSSQIEEDICPISPSKAPEPIVPKCPTTPTIPANDTENENENETKASDDDFHDLPSEFDDDDSFLDESVDNNDDMEFIRSAAKNLMASLAEMDAASTDANTVDAPHSLLYGDDYVVTIKSRRFALAFLDYTQFRVEKQRNPDKFRLLTSLKKQINNSNTNQKKRKDNKQRDDTPSPPLSTIEPSLLATIETKSNKKKRNKRNKKKKTTNNNDNKGIGKIHFRYA